MKVEYLSIARHSSSEFLAWMTMGRLYLKWGHYSVSENKKKKIDAVKKKNLWKVGTNSWTNSLKKNHVMAPLCPTHLRARSTWATRALSWMARPLESRSSHLVE